MPDESLSWGVETPPPLPEYDEDEQWFYQFQVHLLQTVQAIYRLQEALHSRMP